MANPKAIPPKEHQWKPGQSGNKSGLPKHMNEAMQAKRLSASQFAMLVSKFLTLSRAELHEIISNPNATMLELIVGGIVAKTAKEQCEKKASFLLDRTIGKVAEKLELQVDTKTIYKSSVQPDGSILQTVLEEEVNGSGDVIDTRVTSEGSYEATPPDETKRT